MLCRGCKTYFFNALLSVVEQTHFDWWYTETHIQVIPQIQLYSIIRLHHTSNTPKIQAVKRQLTDWSKSRMFSKMFSGFAINPACLRVESFTAFFHSLLAASIAVTSDCVPRFTRLNCYQFCCYDSSTSSPGHPICFTPSALSHADHVQFVALPSVLRHPLVVFFRGENFLASHATLSKRRTIGSFEIIATSETK